MVLTFPHVLVDGTAVTQLVRELLELLGGGPDAGHEDIAVDLPPSADQLFPSDWQRPGRLLASVGYQVLFVLGQMKEKTPIDPTRLDGLT